MYKFRLGKPFIGKEEINSIKKVIASGWVTQGPKTKDLEKIIKNKFKCKHVIATNSASSGIFAGLIALGAKPGDEILTPSNTYVSSLNTMFNLRLKVKLCDVDKYSYAVTPEIFEKSLSKNTKFFLPVHFGGNPIEINKIINFSKTKNIKILDDAAGSIGGKINNRYLGSFDQTITAFSLHANKIITSGEGGFLCLNNLNHANFIRKLINSGIGQSSWRRHQNKRFNYIRSEYPGYKMNYNDILAAVAIEQLRKLDAILDYRRKIYARYISNLKELFEDNIIYTNKPLENTNSSHYCFQITINKKKFNRNKLALHLSDNKIQTSVYYTPAHHHSFLKKKISYDTSKLKNTDFIFRNSISLPIHNHLKLNDIDKITSTIIKYFKNAKK